MQRFFLTLSAVALLSGCSVQSETWVNSGRAQIQEDQFTDSFETAKLDNSMLHAISDYYGRFGNGAINVVVSYDPQSKINTKSNAEKSLLAIQNGLERNGLKDVHAALSSVAGTGDVSTTLVSFPAVTATAPNGCGMMPGYEDPSADTPNDTNIKPTYKYGCTVETLLSRQVVRPSDLMGKQGFETNGDGRRSERVLSSRGYYGTNANAKLEGETASSTK